MELQLRENKIFETLKKLKNFNFVIIGGYAVNAYVLPRFSVDCDIVIKNNKELENIERELFKLNYYKSKNSEELSYGGIFKRYENKIDKGFLVSMDILIKEVQDRQTNAIFSADWIFENSKIKILQGKTIIEELNVRVINIDALFVMKVLSCRLTDIRDIFLLVGHLENKKWVKEEISKRYSFENRLKKIKNEITSKQFKDNLQGVFGFIDPKLFEKHKKLILEL